MDFLLQANIGSYYTNLIFFAIMFVACVALVSYLFWILVLSSF